MEIEIINNNSDNPSDHTYLVFSSHTGDDARPQTLRTTDAYPSDKRADRDIPKHTLLAISWSPVKYDGERNDNAHGGIRQKPRRKEEFLEFEDGGDRLFLRAVKSDDHGAEDALYATDPPE